MSKATLKTTHKESQAAAPTPAHKPFFMPSLTGEDALQRKDAPFFSPQPATPFFSPVQRAAAPAERTTKNHTGLPDPLKSGVESLSGLSMDDVKVHYNSPQPAQLHAHAYAQGNQIHIAPGQEQHLPHEAWHVVQQKQGRVKPTMQLKGKVNINDDAGLEKEADVMGAQLETVGPNLVSPKLNQNGGRMSAKRRNSDIASHKPIQQASYYARAPFFKFSSVNEAPIQAKSYKTEKAKNRHGYQGFIDVNKTDTSIELKGKLIGDEGQGLNTKGVVYMPEYKVQDDRNNPPERIREKEANMGANFFYPSDALRVQNLSAEPRGMKLGQILTYHHGLEAKRRSKPYVVAMKVSDARAPFYAPLGFRDYNGSKPWQSLNDQHNELEVGLRRDADNMEIAEIAKVQRKMAALKDDMEKSSMIIKTDDLITNSKRKFSPIWE